MKKELTLQDFIQRAQKSRKKNITSKQLSEWGKLSVEKRTGHMTDEEKSAYFSQVRLKGLKKK